jgi:hypothetical protein
MSLSGLQKQVHVAKDKKNDFGGYNYRTAEGILAVIKANMPEGAHITVTDRMQEVAGQIFVSATAKLYIPDCGEYEAEGHALHPLTKKGMDPSQITGSASSYARKYALAGLMALDDGSVDPDAAKQPYEEDKTSAMVDDLLGKLKGAIDNAPDAQMVTNIVNDQRFQADAAKLRDMDQGARAQLDVAIEQKKQNLGMEG